MRSRVDKVETVEFCHSFDLSECEKNQAVLSNLYTVSLKREDFVKAALQAVSQFTSFCKEESVVGLIILDVGDYLCDYVTALL